MTAQAIGVVVPARNEEVLLSNCLDALSVAASQVDLPVHVVVVLDDCDDGTELVVARHSSTHIRLESIAVVANNVGVARHAGVIRMLEAYAGLPAEDVWIAMTDADSTVGANWLSEQLAFAALGYEVVVGTVTVLDWQEHSLTVASKYDAAYAAVEGHQHVHGANLGMSAAVYLAAGGFPPVACDEDVALVAALAGYRIARTARSSVVTSARLDSRARGGFGDLLRDLAG